MPRHRQYDRFTRETFEKELPEGFEQTEVVETHELVYEKKLKGGFVIRVYSSIQVDREVSRRRGSDAIKVLLYHKGAETAVKHTSKTYRIRDESGSKKWPENPSTLKLVSEIEIVESVLLITITSSFRNL